MMQIIPGRHVANNPRKTCEIGPNGNREESQMEPIEVYVLCQNREKIIGIAFLNTFLPNRSPLADEFPFPEFVDLPQVVYSKYEDIMQKLENESHESYSLYWKSKDGEGSHQAMLFYTQDGAMIAGLVVPSERVVNALVDVAEVVRGKFGFITLESHPPKSSIEFIDLCQGATLPALVDGKLCNGSAD
jgi:hypothetical protein